MANSPLRRVVSSLRPIKRPLAALSQLECRISRAWTASAHKRLLAVQWAIPPQPEWFDHSIDQYYQFTSSRNPLWVERGIFGGLALKGGDVLELACGDGYNARNFYSIRSRHVTAVDFDKAAIRVAKKRNKAPNVTFSLADIRSSMPVGEFDNVVWDAAIEHFTETEIAKLMVDLKDRLTPEGVLSGYTIVERADGKSLDDHEYEFKSKEDLRRFLTPHFTNVTVFETVYPSRHNLYFWASDGPVPFDVGWPSMIRSEIG